MASNEHIRKLAEAAGLKDAQPQFLHFDLATVVYAIPGLNHYMVACSHNVGGLDKPVMELAVDNNGTAVKHGVTVAHAYQPGTPVIVGRTTLGNKTGVTAPYKLFIMAAVPTQAITDMIQQYPSEYLFPYLDLDYFKLAFKDALISVSPDTALHDNSYGRPMDLMSGDWLAVNAFLNHLFVGFNLASIGSERTSLKIHSMHDKAVLTADNFTSESVCSEEGRRQDLEGVIYFSKQAVTALEGLGVTSGIPFEPDSETGLWKTRAEKQQGIFRHEAYEGLIVDGSWDCFSMPEPLEDKPRSRTEASKPPFGIGSIERTYDGRTSVRSAADIDISRSIYTQIPRELMPEDDEKTFPEPAEAVSWQDDQKLSPEDYPDAAAIRPNEEYEHNSSKFDRARMRARTNNWKLHSIQDFNTTYGIEEDSSYLNKLPYLDGEQAYALPQAIELTDPATGGKRTYYASESHIRQLPDGSISISDGYGSEIRFTRGRILISPASDLELRSGRDTLMMAARHATINAGKDLYAQAANGSVQMKAENNFKILGGNSGRGSVMVEGRGTEPYGDTDKGQGVIIKSHKGAAFTGQDVYVGVYDDTDTSPGGLSRSRSGSVMIDACGGVLSMLGGTGYAKFDRSALFAVAGGGSGSALALGGGIASIYASNINLATATCTVAEPSSSSISLSTLGAGGITNQSFSVNTGSGANLRISGGLSAIKSARIGGDIIATTVTASKGSFGNATKYYSCQGGGSPGKIKIEKIPTGTAETPANSFSEKVDPGSDGVYTGQMLRDSGFGYPDSDTLGVAGANGYRMHGARWQYLLAVGSPVWQEKAVKAPGGGEDTFVYPGRKYWQDEPSLFMGTANGAILSNTYPINANQEPQ